MWRDEVNGKLCGEGWSGGRGGERLKECDGVKAGRKRRRKRHWEAWRACKEAEEEGKEKEEEMSIKK